MQRILKIIRRNINPLDNISSIYTNQGNKLYISTNNKYEEELTDAGFTRIKRKEKEKYVASIFNQCAKEYDFLNDTISLGFHRSWKWELVKHLGSLEPKHGVDGAMEKLRIVDVCGGTGDIAFNILRKAKMTKYYADSKFMYVILYFIR